MKRTRGFTLVELLVAMFITAIMFAMGYAAVRQAIDNRTILQEQQDRLVAVQRTMRMIAQDFTQLVPRPVHEPLNEGMQPALRADARFEGIVSFTRAGWTNPAGVQRASLQRVRYVLDKGTLRREYWPVLDALLAAKPRHRDLLDKVKSVKLRFFAAGSYSEQWPRSSIPGADSNRELPVAIEITVDFEDYGPIMRLFEVAS